LVGRVAAGHGVPVWCHLATHGAIDESRAAWLAGHIDNIGLSCDGPPDVQDAQRPGMTIATSALVERTARVLRESGAAFTVRVTVTPGSVERQEEIVEYAREQLGARRIRLEPVYRGRGGGGAHFRPEDAPRFVTHFVRAAETAKAHGCDVQISGARPGAIHGPYCNVLRGVVQVGPDSVASACFLDAGNGLPQSDHLPIGRVLPESGDLTIDRRRVEALRRGASTIPAGCTDCINVYHCARGCPDVCLATGMGGAADRGCGGFRCRVRRAIATWRVRQMAAGVITS
jgi:sulfatase maturation enzyme AslB (radical SAM superfamily)